MFGPTLRGIAPTSHLLRLVLRISGSRKDIPLSFTSRTHTHTLMLTRMMSRENSFFKHLLQDWILILDDIQKKSNLKEDRKETLSTDAGKAVEKGTCDQFVIVSNRSIACHVALSIEEEGVCESLKSFLPIGSLVKLYSVPPFFDDVVTSLKLELQATIDAGTNH